MKAGDSNRLVLDASVAVAWCFEDEKTSYSEWVLAQMAGGAEALVPSLWPFETANALLQAQRRRRLTAAQSEGFLEQMGQLNIVLDPAPISRVFDRVFFEARQWGLSVYDAAYLELASRAGLPLATLDDSLRKAAKSMGISCAGR